MKNMIIVFFICCCSTVMLSQNNCIIEVTGFKNSKGKCLIYVFKTKKGFPTDPKYATDKQVASIQNGKCSGIIPNMLSGEYAVMVLHDENNNDKMDTNFIGMPKEGIGTSNNAESSFGPPSFNVSKFKIDSKPIQLKITLKYL